MALHYFFGVDSALIDGGFSVIVTDSSGAAGADRTFTVSITTDKWAHVSFSSVVTGYGSLAAVLEAALEAGSALGATPRTYTVSFSTATGYTIAVDAGTKLTLDFTGTTAQTSLMHAVGMTGDRTGALTYSSQVRPYYWLIPTIQGRSNYSDEMEPMDVADESSADDGTAYQVVKETIETQVAWTQMAEPEGDPAGFTFDDPWAPVFARLATSGAPWSYQDAFRHARTGKLPFMVQEDAMSPAFAVYEMRADGVSFRPERFSGPDFAIWSIPFRTRLLGSL